jgi:integrase
MTQAGIAKILDRHPSRVCRRLSLVERLCEEVTENLKLGLINMTMARELAKLSRGNQGKAMSELTMRRYMNSRDMTARPHGFRSSFKTWAADTEQPFEVVETSLSHAVGNKVERTYQRSDHLEKRTALMQRWADHLNSKSADNIVSLSGVSL